jgi:hypothetical protein
MWGDNIKIDPKEIMWDCQGWSHLSQDRGQWRALVNTEIKFGIP